MDEEMEGIDGGREGREWNGRKTKEWNGRNGECPEQYSSNKDWQNEPAYLCRTF